MAGKAELVWAQGEKWHLGGFGTEQISDPVTWQRLFQSSMEIHIGTFQQAAVELIAFCSPSGQQHDALLGIASASAAIYQD